MTLQHRLAEPDDIAAICALADELNAIHHAAWPQVFAPPADADRDRAHWLRGIEHADARTFLVVEDGALLGFLSAIAVRQPPGLLQPLLHVQIRSVCVRHDRRGQGLGRGLMARAEAWAADLGAAEVRLNVWQFNARAIALYEELGYAVRALSMAKSTAHTISTTGSHPCTSNPASSTAPRSP